MTPDTVLSDLDSIIELPCLGYLGDRDLLSDQVLKAYMNRMGELKGEMSLKSVLLGRVVRRGLSEDAFRSYMDEYKEHVSTLDVSGCLNLDLSSLPLLDQITSIYCGNCGLTSVLALVSLVERCPKLTFLHLQTQSESIPGRPNHLPSILTRLAPHEAVQYIHEFRNTSDPLAELRLVLLGHGTAGKTTLKLSLLEQESESSAKSPNEPRLCRSLAVNDRTNGVNVNEVWPISHVIEEGTWDPEFALPTIRILDFPGQSEFYSSNRLLLSSLENTICLVAARLVPIEFELDSTSKTSLREAMDAQWKLNEAQLSFWLTMLDDMSRYEATDSGNLDSKKPVFVVFTCADLADLTHALELKDMWVKMNEARFHHLTLSGVSCVSGREIDSEAVASLRYCVACEAQSMMEGEAVPRSILGVKDAIQNIWRQDRLLPTALLRKKIQGILRTDRQEVVTLILKSLQVAGLVLPVESVGVTVIDPFWLSLVVNKVVCPVDLGGIPCNDSGQEHVVTRASLHNELSKLVSMLRHLLSVNDNITEEQSLSWTDSDDSVISREGGIQHCLDHPSSDPNTFKVCFEGDVQRLSAGILGQFRKYKSRYIVVVSPGYILSFQQKKDWESFQSALAKGAQPRSVLSLLHGRGIFRITSISLRLVHIDSDVYDMSLVDLGKKRVIVRMKLSPVQRDELRAGMAHAMPINVEVDQKVNGDTARDHNNVDVICEVLQSLDVMFLLSPDGANQGIESTLDPSSDRFLIPSRLVEDAPVGQTWKDHLQQYRPVSVHLGVDGAVVNVVRFSSLRKDPFPPALIGRIVFALYEMPSIKKQENFLTAYRGEVRVSMSSGTEILFRFAPNDCWFDVALVCKTREESEIDVPLVLQALVELLDGRCAEVSNVRLPFLTEERCLHCLLSDRESASSVEQHSQVLELHSREAVELMASRSSIFTGCIGSIPHDLKLLYKEFSLRESEIRNRQSSRLQGWTDWSSSKDGGSVLRLIPMQEVEGIKCVSDGNFGVVFEGQYKGKRVAVKAPKRHVQADDQWREFSLWSSLPRHPNICPLLGFCESFAFDTPTAAALGEDPTLKPLAYRSLTSKWKKSGRRRQSFLEKPEKTDNWTRVQARDSMMLPFVGPSLLNIAHATGRSSLNEETTFRYLMDVARALVVLHDKRIVHRDIALRNVLVFDDGHRACLTDFGLSAKGKPRKKKHVGEAQEMKEQELDSDKPDFSVKMKKGMFPVKLFAPEVFLTMEYGPEADVYMFGWMVANMLQRGSEPEWRDIYESHYYEVPVGSTLFKEKLQNDQLYLDMNETLQGVGEGWKKAFAPLVHSCTLVDPSQRFSMRAVYHWLLQNSTDIPHRSGKDDKQVKTI